MYNSIFLVPTGFSECVKRNALKGKIAIQNNQVFSKQNLRTGYIFSFLAKPQTENFISKILYKKIK